MYIYMRKKCSCHSWGVVVVEYTNILGKMCLRMRMTLIPMLLEKDANPRGPLLLETPHITS